MTVLTKEEARRRRDFIQTQTMLLLHNGLGQWAARIAAAKDWESLQTFIHMKPVTP